MKVEIIIYSI